MAGLGLPLRHKILTRDHFMCLYCGARPPGVKLVVDHVRSRASGGGDEPSNLITACEPCNQGKSARNVDYCASCVRPLCRGPLDPRDDLEAGCKCTCHACQMCLVIGCEDAATGICASTIVAEEELFHDVSVEEAFE